MASLRDLRRRIRDVGKIKQITRAMQFVAASKLKRAQDATLNARPYAEAIDEVLADVAAVLSGEDHPLLGTPEKGKRLIVLFTSDRGLAGPFNTNTIRFVARAITEHQGDLAVVAVGRKGRDALRRARVPIEAYFDGFGDRPSFADVVPLARLVTDDYRSGGYERIDLVYSQFVSTLVQRPALEQLLPRYVAQRLFQAVLESKASEESSRMVAMRNATDNADDLIDDYTLEYNKVRQTSITREMIEIATGAQAR